MGSDAGSDGKRVKRDVTQTNAYAGCSLTNLVSGICLRLETVATGAVPVETVLMD